MLICCDRTDGSVVVVSVATKRASLGERERAAVSSVTCPPPQEVCLSNEPFIREERQAMYGMSAVSPCVSIIICCSVVTMTSNVIVPVCSTHDLKP